MVAAKLVQRLCDLELLGHDIEERIAPDDVARGIGDGFRQRAIGIDRVTRVDKEVWRCDCVLLRKSSSRRSPHRFPSLVPLCRRPTQVAHHDVSLAACESDRAAARCAPALSPDLRIARARRCRHLPAGVSDRRAPCSRCLRAHADHVQSRHRRNSHRAPIRHATGRLDPRDSRQSPARR